MGQKRERQRQRKRQRRKCRPRREEGRSEIGRRKRKKKGGVQGTSDCSSHFIVVSRAASLSFFVRWLDFPTRKEKRDVWLSTLAS